MSRSAPPTSVSGAKQHAALPGYLLGVLAAFPVMSQDSVVTTPALAAPAAAASWPHTLVRDGATVTIYQPQATSWPDRRRLDARAALAINARARRSP